MMRLEVSTFRIDFVEGFVTLNLLTNSLDFLKAEIDFLFEIASPKESLNSSSDKVKSTISEAEKCNFVIA